MNQSYVKAVRPVTYCERIADAGDNICNGFQLDIFMFLCWTNKSLVSINWLVCGGNEEAALCLWEIYYITSIFTILFTYLQYSLQCIMQSIE